MGRPSKLLDDLVRQRILDAIRKGNTRETSAAAAGIGSSTLRLWLSKGRTVTVTRIAPSSGLDPHDGLGAALKGVIDGVADALGLRNDRDPSVEWKLAQRRGQRGEYAVEVVIVTQDSLTTR